jgi:hypothetical protein
MVRLPAIDPLSTGYPQGSTHPVEDPDCRWRDCWWPVAAGAVEGFCVVHSVALLREAGALPCDWSVAYSPRGRLRWTGHRTSCRAERDPQHFVVRKSRPARTLQSDTLPHLAADITRLVDHLNRRSA